MGDSDTPKPKHRPIVRLGLLLISHSSLLSVICCAGGVVALLLLPVVAKSTYISENALMPGSASNMISSHDVAEANTLVRDLSGLSSSVERRGIIARYLSDLGAEVSYHKFHLQLNKFHPLHFFSGPDMERVQENFNCSSYGVSLVGIIRAPRGDGKEAIVLVTPYDFEHNGIGETLALSIGYAVFSLLSRVTWLAKDIVWLIADSQYGDYAPVSAWLREYHMPVFTALSATNPDSCTKGTSSFGVNEVSSVQKQTYDYFRRAGTMAAALVLKVADSGEKQDDALSIYAEASNGQMPNLDLINIVNYLAVHRQGFHVKIEKLLTLLDSKWLEVLGETFDLLGRVASSLNPRSKFGIPAIEYVEGTATLASSMYRQALGIPTGPHGAFRDFQVDAITLEVSPRLYNLKSRHNELILRGGRLIEGVIRSINNLLEKFHQSFFLYLLTSPSKFVSVGVYMIAFALIVAPLPLVAASLYIDAHKLDPGLEKGKLRHSIATSGEQGVISLRSWKWLNAANEVFIIHAWGAIASFLPYIIAQIPNCSPTTSFTLWMLLSLLSLRILYFILVSPFSDPHASQPQKGDWLTLKSVTISAVFIGLLLMSVVNFATAEIGALLIIPLCLLVRPLKVDMKVASLRSFLRIICNLVLGLVVFPPAAFFMVKGIFGGFDMMSVGDYWHWVESLWTWNSGTYIFIGMVHLPCWVLCIRILFHSC